MRQSREGAGGGIAEGTQSSQQCGEESMNPLIGFPLHHAEQAPVDHLESISFQVGKDEKQPIFRRRQRAVFVHAKPARGPRLPIHPPCRHLGVERRLEGWDQLLKLVQRHAREIQKLHRARLQLGKP